MEQTLAKVDELSSALNEVRSRIKSAQQSAVVPAKMQWLQCDDLADLSDAQEFMTKHGLTLMHFKKPNLLAMVKIRLDEEQLELLSIYQEFVQIKPNESS